MGKALTEMSLEELWQLFPIFLTQHQACWAEWYAAEAAALRAALPPYVRLSHIGSTAIPDIWAKPIIDILAEAPANCSLMKLRDTLTRSGYLCMNQQPSRLSFNKGYTEHGFAEKVFHLHLRYQGDNDELYFRDYLRAHPDTALQYEALKLDLWKKFEHDRDGYTDAKSAFVLECTRKAKNLYPNRYSAL